MKTSFLDLAQSRYTTKKYDSTFQLTEKQIEELQEVLRLSPSSINSQPWKFSFVASPEIKAKLAEVSYFNAPKVLDSSHIVVFSAIDDIEAFENQIQENLPEGSVAYYNAFLKNLPEVELKAWLQHQVYLSLGFFLSACVTMDIDSTPMEGIQSAEYAEILGLDGYKPLFAVAIGKRNIEDANQPALKAKSRLAMEKITTFHN